MIKINIYLKLDNKDMPYEYRGEATINKDIIEFNDNEYNYMFDKKIKRLVKSHQNNILIIDFKNEEIKVIEGNKEFVMKIKVRKMKINEKDIEIIYKVDNNDIIFKLKEV